MIHVKCASCEKEYKLPDSAAGRKARCKACGEAMVIPDAPDDLFDDSGPAGDDLTSLYASSDDTAPVIDHSAPAGDALAFNPETSFQQSTPSRVPSAPPMKLLIGAGAGVLGLIVIVVVVVVIVMSGGDDAQEQQRSDSLALNLDTAVPSANPGTSAPETTGLDRNQPRDDTPSQPVPDNDTDTVANPDGSDESTESPGDEPDGSDEPGDSDGPEVDTPLQESPVANQPAAPELLTPTSCAYGIVLPEGLSLISQTRVAIRTAPHEDGTWLSMEVHKLSGLDRRQAAALADDGASVLVRGRRVAVPAGAELSDVVSDRFTAKRLLYPKQPGETLRRVAYVIKDGPYLVSVLGRYPVGDAARLALLDEAAKSVQPVQGR